MSNLLFVLIRDVNYLSVIFMSILISNNLCKKPQFTKSVLVICSQCIKFKLEQDITRCLEKLHISKSVKRSHASEINFFFFENDIHICITKEFFYAFILYLIEKIISFSFVIEM